MYVIIYVCPYNMYIYIDMVRKLLKKKLVENDVAWPWPHLPMWLWSQSFYNARLEAGLCDALVRS